MRTFSVLFFAFFLIVAASFVSTTAFAAGAILRPSSETKPAKAPVATAPNKATTRNYSGRVLSPNGPLAGAVVEVPGTKLMTVTNAEGEFSLTVPVRRAPLRLTASYAGFEDESLTLASDDKNVTLELATLNAIKIAHNQELTTYVKNAQREVKYSLKSL